MQTLGKGLEPRRVVTLTQLERWIRIGLFPRFSLDVVLSSSAIVGPAPPPHLLPSTTSLLHLPIELIALIVNKVAYRDAVNLCSTCRRLRAAADKLAHTTPNLRTPVDIHGFLQAPEVALPIGTLQHVRTITITLDSALTVWSGPVTFDGFSRTLQYGWTQPSSIRIYSANQLRGIRSYSLPLEELVIVTPRRACRSVQGGLPSVARRAFDALGHVLFPSIRPRKVTFTSNDARARTCFETNRPSWLAHWTTLAEVTFKGPYPMPVGGGKFLRPTNFGISAAIVGVPPRSIRVCVDVPAIAPDYRTLFENGTALSRFIGNRLGLRAPIVSATSIAFNFTIKVSTTPDLLLALTDVAQLQPPLNALVLVEV